jgi:alpha-1,3-mannosyltransferase
MLKQFYCWYFHSLPLLLWNARLPTVVRVVIFAAIEYAFNVYPATALSSLVLQASHGLLLGKSDSSMLVWMQRAW